MKILFVLGCTNPFAGAAWTRIGFFAQNWSVRGHDVAVLGTFTPKSLDKRGTLKIGNLTICNLVLNLSLSHPIVFAMNSAISAIVSTFLLIVKRPTKVIVSIPSGDMGLGALVSCKLLRVKCSIDYRDEWEDYVLSFRHNKLDQLFYSLVKKFSTCLYAKCKIIVAVTSEFMESLKLRGLSNVVIVSNGADATTFKPLETKKESTVFRLFYSGFVGEYYRLDIVVKSVKLLVERGCENIMLDIAGEGARADVERVIALSERLGVSNNVNYYGVITDKNQLAALVMNSDVGIIPYNDNLLWKNSLPAKFFEYCACGIPVVATAYEDSILSDLINQNGLGLTSPPLDAEKLADSIYCIYSNKAFRIKAGKNARAFIEEKYDRNKLAETYLNIMGAL